MKRLSVLVWVLLLLLIFVSGCPGSGGGGGAEGGGNDGNDEPFKPLMGMLQFRVRHNLQDDSCVARGDCFYAIEEEDQTAAWLAQIAADSDLAVLHWDRAVPWLAFDADPPVGTSRTDFFDGRIDAKLRSWINAFAAHFASLPYSYLAVTPLHGLRDKLERCRINEDLEVEITDACPDVGPGAVIQFQYDPGSGPVTASFDLEKSYRNFVLYLYDKLRPDYFAIMVEVNMYKTLCPTKWSGLVDLYRTLYDTVRAEVDSETKVFATVVFQDLLDYEVEQCHGALAFEACVGAPGPPVYPVPDPTACYPLDLSAIMDLDQGDRLEILALSFYPDNLLMAVSENDNLLYAYPEDWDETSDCLMRAQLPPFLDPIAALDRFNWSKPVAIAELGARSCRTLQFIDDGLNRFIIQPAGDLTSQTFWLDHFLESAGQRKFEFYVQVFRNDYYPIGLWAERQGVLPENLYNVNNIFPCMGLYDDNGQVKDGITDIWQNALP
ncbi:MAG: hypothetical protein WBM69_04835 [Desulfobacterales bacterium]